MFTDAEAGALEFPSSTSRSYNYFTPRKRRGTVYEDVTVHVQPDPERHLTQGWIYAFADGSAGYPPDWTALKSSDWHKFLDPNEEWEQTIYRNNANVVRQVKSNVESAKDAGAFAAFNTAWTKVLEQHVFTWAHAEHRLGLHVYTPAQRDAPTNMINNARRSARRTSCASPRTSSSTTSSSPGSSRTSTGAPTSRPGRTTRSGSRRARTWSS